MADIVLRDYQERLIGDARSAFRQHRRVLLQAPTGAGKTTIFSWLTQATAARGKRICISAHRRELLNQISDRLGDFGVDHAVLDARLRGVTRAQVVVAGIATLARRIDHYQDAFDLLVLDEAHHAVAGQWATVLSALPKAFTLGVTATPERLDGRGLGDAFDHLIEGPPVRELINRGYLSDYVAYAPADGGPNVRAIKSSMGDFDARQLAELMSKSELVGNAVEHYRRHAQGLPAVAFCVSVAHAEAVAQQFRDAGYRSVAVDGKLDDAERDRRIGGLGAGEIDVLCSCDLISEGLDVPGISAVIMLRPTMSLGLYLQQVGRGLRPKANGGRLILLDHAGNVTRHGFPCQPRTWSLDAVPRKKRMGETSNPVKTCEDCYAVLPSATAVCPHCGHEFAPPEREITHREGELVEVRPRWYGEDGRPIVERNKADIDAALKRCSNWKDIVDLRRALGYKPGWERAAAERAGWKPIQNRQGFPFMYLPPSQASQGAVA